ncbi:hypothetical protein DERP_011847 [Dermatophagoides pteronyssinus]|uniref:Uncharacterized protein n=1 Tax=Dermatophagoides pteronyssinus TaxID=6956 RepID=A0ABQ8JR78_DERPT|nr:hypothetical protein DERP_011847 [Dermatophagoides pteronyssinus]
MNENEDTTPSLVLAGFDGQTATPPGTFDGNGLVSSATAAAGLTAGTCSLVEDMMMFMIKNKIFHCDEWNGLID